MKTRVSLKNPMTGVTANIKYFETDSKILEINSYSSFKEIKKQQKDKLKISRVLEFSSCKIELNCFSSY